MLIATSFSRQTPNSPFSFALQQSRFKAARRDGEIGRHIQHRATRGPTRNRPQLPALDTRTSGGNTGEEPLSVTRTPDEYTRVRDSSVSSSFDSCISFRFADQDSFLCRFPAATTRCRPQLGRRTRRGGRTPPSPPSRPSIRFDRAIPPNSTTFSSLAGSGRLCGTSSSSRAWLEEQKRVSSTRARTRIRIGTRSSTFAP